MVMKGQFLERPTVIPVADLFLEGLAHRGDRLPPLLICPPAPDDGSSMDFPVMAELAFAASRAGHATLRYNARGTGASQGWRGGRPEDLADARAALDLLLANAGARAAAVAAFGRAADIGVGIAEAAADAEGPAVDRVIAAAPTELDLDRCGRLSVPVLFVVGSEDPLVDRRALADHCQRTGDQLCVISGADHAFSRGLSELGRAAVEFLSGGIPAIGEEP